MKLTAILLTIGCLQLSAKSFSQNITLSGRNISFEKVLEAIEKQSGYLFFYTYKELERAKPVTVHLDNVPLKQALEQSFRGQPFSYSISNKAIIIAKKEDDVSKNQSLLLNIRGKVTDEKGQPLPGATIKVKGSNLATISDAQGAFTLSNIDENAVLVISFTGFTSQEITVEGKGEMLISLKEEPLNLNQVVVVGYGTQKKENLTGAVSVVDAKLLESRPASNMSQMLQGTVPNMNVSFSSGRPGNGGRFNIRGVNSISSNSDPLILIDGIEGNIDRLNPQDVASVTVLKDASSAAVYGARASFGVILITTKEGNGKAKISYSGKYATGKPTTSTDYETRGYYSASINDLFYNQYTGNNYTTYTDDDYYQLWLRRDDKTEHPDRPWVVTDRRDGRDTYVYYGNTDWYEYLYDDRRPLYEHSVNVTGGSEKVSYLLSGNMFDQKGVFRMNKDKFSRYNLRSKISASITDWLEISNNTAYYHSDYFYPGRSGIDNNFSSIHAHGLASFVPQNPDGTWVYANSLSNSPGIMDGISAMLSHNGHRNQDKAYDLSSIFEATVKLTKKLELKANYSYTYLNTSTLNRAVNIPYSQYPGQITQITSGIGLNQLSEGTTRQDYKALNVYSTYSDTFAKDHNLKVMAGYNYETRRIKDLRMNRQGLLTDLLDDFNLAKGDVMNITGGQNEYAIMGAFYRLNYNYKGKYLFETSGRYDGSSRFRRGSRFGFFPSFSAGWRISEEVFFEPLKEVVGDFKLRASYGSLGNQQVGYYDYIQTVSTGTQLNYSFGDGIKAPAATESAPNAADLTWETVSSTNLGVDMSFFKQRLSLTADVYMRETKDMLTAGKKLPSVYGASAPRQNAADLKTKGWEASIQWKNTGAMFSKALNYNIGFSIGDNTTTITRFDNPSKNLSDFYEGQQLGDIWGYHIDGYFLTDEEAANYQVDQKSVNTIINSSAIDRGIRAGDLKFVDLNGDNKISLGANTANNSGDRRVIGNALPRYNFGANLGADWNGIDVSLFIQGVGKQNWYPGTEATGFWGPYSRPYATFIPRDFLSKVWSEENPDAYFPRPRGYVALNASNRSLGVANNKYLQNLAYARLKNITIGYSLPQRWISKAKLSRCRLYFSGENLFTVTGLKTKYIDPEQASASNSFDSPNTSTSTARIYPWAKMYSFGLDLTL